METVLSKEKLAGRFYTPDFIVGNILDLAGYCGRDIIKKHVIDNSCGDGAFLVAVAERYCDCFLETCGDLEELSEELSRYVHGIEIDRAEAEKCVENLNAAVIKFGLKDVKWDILCADALTVDKYDGKMDYVVGNPPYVRVHNLGESSKTVKKFLFAQSGMTDLYIAFYEIGLKMLNENGVLGYITPSSFFNSIAGKRLRFFLVQNNLIDKIVDLKHFLAFGATTYTTIAVLKRGREKTATEYYRFENSDGSPLFIDNLDADDYAVCGNFYFAEKDELKELKAILNFKSAKSRFTVKNGFATLADDFFIGDFGFDEFTIPVVKASTGKRYKCIFPYSEGKLVPYGVLTENRQLKDRFESHKKQLQNRSLEKPDGWYGFGRTQGINDVYSLKYSVNAIIKTPQDLKLIKCDKGVGVYSGLYIITEVPESVLREMLYSEDFINYVSMLGKYKNGGYYTFSSKDLKNYLEYKYSQRNGFENEQFSIFGYSQKSVYNLLADGCEE